MQGGRVVVYYSYVSRGEFERQDRPSAEGGRQEQAFEIEYSLVQVR